MDPKYPLVANQGFMPDAYTSSNYIKHLKSFAFKIHNNKYEAFNVPLPTFLDELLVAIDNDRGIVRIFPNGKRFNPLNT